MGGCSSKENNKGSTEQMQRPTAQNRGSITYIRPRDDKAEGERGMKRYVSSETTKTLQMGGLNVRYGYMSQRGYYPDEEGKPNQDSFSINTEFAKQGSDALFAVYDGHGRDGDKCAQFSSDHLPNILSRHIRKMKKTNAEADQLPDDVELNKDKVQAAINLAHKQCNRAMHASRDFEDALSGTTAISTYFQGRRNRVTISNVGDSRAVLGQRINRDDAALEDGSYRALPLSRDQTPYRSGERKRIRACGARILSLDQIEGVEPINEDDDDSGTNIELGEEIDEGGDPPRVWHPTMDYPGTAFTRSLGDRLAEELGVIADPEMVTRELKEGDEIIVLASDGVFEFLTNQSVIDICAKFKDPLEACQAVISQSYELWLQYELRTDDITMICMFIDGIDKPKEDLYSSEKNGSSHALDNLDDIGGGKDALRQQKANVGKMSKRLNDMKALLEESLQDAPTSNSNGGFDFKKIYTEKTEEDKETIRRASRSSVMLQSMTEEQMEMIYGVIQPLEVEPGDWIIRQGEDGDKFYIVEDGEFEVRISGEPKTTKSGGKVVHTYQGSKENRLHPTFGELALLYASPRAATVISKTAGKLWALDRGALKAILLGIDGKQDLVKILRSIRELDGFKDEEIEDFASNMEEVSFKKGTNISVSGETGKTLYIVSKGSCVINLEAGGEKLSSTLQNMDYFGQEMMASGRYLATVEALTDTMCWKLDKSAIQYSMKKLQAVREGRTTIN